MFEQVHSTESNVLYSDIKNKIITDNYLYISHIDKGWGNTNNPNPNFWVLPCYPDEISDTMDSSFMETSALGRTAPVYTYSKSGPRKVQISITLHRDLFDEVNIGISNVELADYEDYVDSLIRALQSIALPKYNASNKMIEPPMVAIRLGNEVFIKGIVSGGIGLTYGKPILYNNKYAIVTLSLGISETDPYDAESVFKNGSFRGMVNTFRNIYDAKGDTIEQRMGD